MNRVVEICRMRMSFYADVANAYTIAVVDAPKKLRENYSTQPSFVQNVVTDMTQELILAAADIVKVYESRTSVCTTSTKLP